MSPLQLQVIPDEWTRLPPFTPGKRDVWAVHGDAVIKITLRTGELVITAAQARQLAGSYTELQHKAEIIAELARELGTLDPVLPADPALAAAVRNGNSYRFAPGGLVVQ